MDISFSAGLLLSIIFYQVNVVLLVIKFQYSLGFSCQLGPHMKKHISGYGLSGVSVSMPWLTWLENFSKWAC